jgi:DNA repair protein RecN (Recombination protein N)
MLTQLTIKNYALIKHLVLEPSHNLNVITGETGAGKSIMLGAVGLLMGNRADTRVLWNENDKCVVEGSYDISDYKLKSFFKSEDLDYDETTVIRREISPGGKSRAFINDTPVTLEVMKRLGNLLMDVHSQHETLQLGNQSFQLQLIDAFAQNTAIREEYSEAWGAYLKAKKHFETLTSEAETLRNEADYVKFQLDELQKADLIENEQESLESELKVMEHAEEIKSRFNSVLDLLSRSELSAQTNVSASSSQLRYVVDFSPAYEALLKRIESIRIELEDIVNELENEEGSIEFDPQRTEFVKEKLSTIYRLLKKHHVSSLRDLITLQNELRQKADLTSNLDEALSKASASFVQSETQVKKNRSHAK